jgi:ribonuclease P protein component
MSAPTNQSGQKLSRSLRLRASRDFLRLKGDGLRHAQGCLILNWQVAGSVSKSRLGVITSRRVGPAVVRNRARRLLREVFRRRRDLINQPTDVVLVARPSIAGLNYARVERDFMEALRRAKLLNNHSAPGAGRSSNE